MARRVPRFHDFVGHKTTVDVLCRQLEGAKALGEPFPPTLFSGPSGVGKTLLAKSVAEAYGSKVIRANGFNSVEELTHKFMKVNVGDFVFIDEAHNLTRKAQELLFGVIDKSEVPPPNQIIETGSDTSTAPEGESPNIAIKRCTVILATDQPGKLLNALANRLELKISLGYYSNTEMHDIVDSLAAQLNLLISPQAKNLVAKVSGGLPRQAEHILRNLRRHAYDTLHEQIEIKQVRQLLHECQIDEQGLRAPERKYLERLLEAEPASLDSLALHLGTDCDDVQYGIERSLSRAGFIRIGPGGRYLTDAGREWITGNSEQNKLEES